MIVNHIVSCMHTLIGHREIGRSEKLHGHVILRVLKIGGFKVSKSETGHQYRLYPSHIFTDRVLKKIWRALSWYVEKCQKWESCMRDGNEHRKHRIATLNSTAAYLLLPSIEQPTVVLSLPTDPASTRFVKNIAAISRQSLSNVALFHYYILESQVHLRCHP